MHFNIKKIVYFLFFIFIFSVYASAQNLPPAFDPNVDDNTSNAPISELIYLGLAVGTALGYKYRKKS